jgi:SpoVK/Ycf46/Vps4 family AAA+-type ATPase
MKYINSKKITKQMIYEYVSSSIDDSENREMKFNHFVFKSNKWLDRNIFFENKTKFLENIRKFPYRKDIINEKDSVGIIKKSAAELEYEYFGKSFKNIILLHGPPGCGKTSVIKGILNETKRHGIVVQWSRIKTCADFSALFRSLKINDETYSLGELCYIFEDFDANKIDLLKKRKNLSTISSVSNSDDSVDILEKNNENNENKNIIDMKKIIMSMPINDELTLDYVLNIFDGVMELYDAMIIFTTNVKIDNFDPALIRPGRIDTILEMKECNWNIVLDMLQHYYCLTDYEMIDKYEENNHIDSMIRPCEVEDICMKCENIDHAICEIFKFCNK